MSLNDFWLNVRTAARNLVPGVIADSPRVDTARIEDILKLATFWLTPGAVDGFNPDDFRFLTPAERKDLTHAVDRFHEIARQVPPEQPATDQQIRRALPHFRRIVEILGPERYGDPEALELGKRVEQQLDGQWPPSVSELRFETRDDASGGPGLWIWVVFKDEAVQGDDLLPNVRAVSELLTRTVRKLGTERWPYVRFRTISDLEPAAKKVKK